MTNKLANKILEELLSSNFESHLSQETLKKIEIDFDINLLNNYSGNRRGPILPYQPLKACKIH